MPTAFGNYTPQEVQAMLAKRDRLDEKAARAIVTYVLITGEWNTVLLQHAVAALAGSSAWERLMEEERRRLRLEGKMISEPYDNL